MATQGKCPRCRVRYEFVTLGRVSLKHLRCPKCGEHLRRTSYLSRLFTIVRDPLVGGRDPLVGGREVSRE